MQRSWSLMENLISTYKKGRVMILVMHKRMTSRAKIKQRSNIVVEKTLTSDSILDFRLPSPKGSVLLNSG